MSGCWNRIQTLCLFRRLQSLLSLSLFFFFFFFIPQSSTAALVYSNQGAGRRLPEGIFTLEYEIYSPLGGIEPWVPALIPPQPNNNSQSAQPRQKRITPRCWLVPARTRRSRVSHDSHFPPLRKKGQEGTKEKQGGLSELPWSLSVALPCFASSISWGAASTGCFPHSFWFLFFFSFY